VAQASNSSSFLCCLVALSHMITRTLSAEGITGRYNYAVSNEYVRYTSELQLRPDGTYSYLMFIKTGIGCQTGYLLDGKWRIDNMTIYFTPSSAKRGCARAERAIDIKAEHRNFFNGPTSYRVRDRSLCFKLDGNESCYTRAD
jgi:hypothetical protein